MRTAYVPAVPHRVHAGGHHYSGGHSYGSYSGHGGAGLLRQIEHAAVWHLVGRAVDRLPFWAVAALLAGLLVLGTAGALRGRRRRRTP